MFSTCHSPEFVFESVLKPKEKHFTVDGLNESDSTIIRTKRKWVHYFLIVVAVKIIESFEACSKQLNFVWMTMNGCGNGILYYFMTTFEKYQFHFNTRVVCERSASRTINIALYV